MFVLRSKDGQELEAGKNIEMTSEGGECKLVLREVKTTDAGDYSCRITGATAKAACSATLAVKGEVRGHGGHVDFNESFYSRIHNVVSLQQSSHFITVSVFSQICTSQETFLFSPYMSAVSHSLLQRTECHGRVT